MQGPNIEDIEMQGIIPRMVRTVFNRIENADVNIEFQVKVSMCEIYNEKIKDLQNPKMNNLRIHEEKGKGVYIQDIKETYCTSEDDVFNVMKVGNSNRAITATNMNAESSRSHSLFVLTIIMQNNEDQSCKTGKLYLVDLAGSEKISKTGAEGQTLEEAKNINQSLSTLGKVIGGNSKTCLIITCSPHPYNELETLSTLRFGARARNIKNAPKMNKEYSVAELKKMLAAAEFKISTLEGKIKALVNQIISLGGQPPSDSELQQLQAKLEAEESKKVEEEKEPELPDDDLGDLPSA
jgi:kinesin family protein 5